jgi:hypothetical protein
LFHIASKQETIRGQFLLPFLFFEFHSKLLAVKRGLSGFCSENGSCLEKFDANRTDNILNKKGSFIDL